MLYQPPFVPGATPGVPGIFNSDPDAGYVNGDPSTGAEGSYFPNAAIEHPQRELVKLLTSLGITPSVAVLEQVAEAVSRGASLGIYGTGGGTANAQTITKSGNVVVSKALFTGMRVRFRPSVTNTGATTVNAFTLGVKPILTWDGAALVGGELLANFDTEIEYDASLATGAGAWRIVPWAMAPTKFAAQLGIPFNVSEQVVTTRTILNGTGFLTFTTGSYTKKSATSALLVRVSGNVYDGGIGTACAIMRVAVSGINVEGMVRNMDGSTSSAAGSSYRRLTGVPVGALAWTASFGRNDGATWRSIVCPNTTDAAYLPPATHFSLHFSEIE